MAYVTWGDYEIKYLRGRAPTVPEEEFAYWADMASDTINQFTHGRIDDAALERYGAEICRAACALVDFYYVPSALNEYAGFKSVSVTGHSVTIDDRTQNDKEKEARSIVYRYLGSTGLLYRGVR